VIDKKTTDEQIQKDLEAKYSSQNEVGVMQHHDAITGTCWDKVSADYVSRIFNGIEKTNPVYAQALDKISQKAGFSEQ